MRKTDKTVLEEKCEFVGKNKFERGQDINFSISQRLYAHRSQSSRIHRSTTQQPPRICHFYIRLGSSQDTQICRNDKMPFVKCQNRGNAVNPSISQHTVSRLTIHSSDCEYRGIR